VGDDSFAPLKWRWLRPRKAHERSVNGKKVLKRKERNLPELKENLQISNAEQGGMITEYGGYLAGMTPGISEARCRVLPSERI
jgi:hypothetical protein